MVVVVVVVVLMVVLMVVVVVCEVSTNRRAPSLKSTARPRGRAPNCWTPKRLWPAGRGVRSEERSAGGAPPTTCSASV